MSRLEREAGLTGRPAREAGFIAAWALVSTLFTFHGVLAGKTLYFRDLSRYFVPGKLAVTRAILSGELPLWDPCVYTGTPLLAQLGLAVLYPLNIVFALFDPGTAVNLYVLVHYGAAVVTMYAFLRGQALGPLAAAAGGTAYAWSGIALSDAAHPSHIAIYSIAPLLLSLPARLSGRRLFLAASVVWALMCTTGSAERLISYAALGVAFSAFRGARSAFILVSAMAIGSLLAAPVWLPAIFNMVNASARADGLAWNLATTASLIPIQAFESVLPIPLVAFDGTLARGIFGDFPIYPTFYCGVSTAALAACALLDETRRRPMIFWSAAVLISTVVALGANTPLYSLLWDHLPLVKVFRYPSKHFAIAVFGIAALAGIGTDALLRQGRRAAITMSLSTIALWGALRLFALHAHSGEFILEVIGEIAGQSAPYVVILIGIALAPDRFRLIPWLIPAVVFFDLVAAGGRFAPLTDPSIYHPPPVAALIGTDRFVSSEEWTQHLPPAFPPSTPRAHLMSAGIAPNFGALWNMRHADGYIEPKPRAASAYIETARAEADDGAAMLGELAVRWRLEPAANEPLAAVWRRVVVDTFAGLALYENTLVRPRARVANDTASARIVTDGYAAIVIETNSDTSGTLILADAWAEGWTATVNGRPAAVTSKNGMTRSVFVPPGPAVVKFTYRPPGWLASAALTCLGILTLCSIAYREVRDRSSTEVR